MNLGSKKLIRVYADMVADLFHHGHLEFLKNASAMGDYLIVGIMSDYDAVNDNRQPILTVEERVAVIVGCRYVDEVIPNAPWSVNADWIAQHYIDFIVHGDDFFEEELVHYYSVPIVMGIFRTIPYTPGISTTEIITRCKDSDLGSKKTSSFIFVP